MARSDFAFFHSLRVRWAEVDRQDIVFNGHYLTYFDVGFTEYWRATGLPSVIEQSAAGKELFARKASIEFFDSARFDDVLDIGVRCAGLGRSSMRFVVEIHRGDQHLISGELIYVYADVQAKKGIPVPEQWREAIIGMEKCAPQPL